MSHGNSIKYLPQITMLLKHAFLNSYLVELGITVTDGRVVFSHNLLFLRKIESLPEIQYQATFWEQVCLADQMRNNSSCLIIQSNLKKLPL